MTQIRITLNNEKQFIIIAITFLVCNNVQQIRKHSHIARIVNLSQKGGFVLDLKTWLIGLVAMVGAPWAVATCWDQAAATYRLDPLLLKAIGWQESRGWSNAVGPELPGNNRALGVMQINTVHLPILKKFGIEKQDLFDPCVSVTVGAWVLADCIEQFGAVWRAIGCYYAGPRSVNYTKQASYVRDVQRHYQGYLQQQLQASQSAKLQTVSEATP